MQSTEEEALSPPELQSRITDILTASPNIAEAVSFVCSIDLICLGSLLFHSRSSDHTLETSCFQFSNSHICMKDYKGLVHH